MSTLMRRMITGMQGGRRWGRVQILHLCRPRRISAKSTPRQLTDRAKLARDEWAKYFRIRAKDMRVQTFDTHQVMSRAEQIVQIHSLLAAFHCHVSRRLFETLNRTCEKEPDFVPHGEPLRSIVEILKHYHSYTADMIAEVSSAEESTVEGWDNWLGLRDQVQSHAQRLETFLPRPVLLEDTIPTESLLELCIQCYLDCVTNRHQILDSIEDVLRDLRERFQPHPPIDPDIFIALPKTIFLSSTAHGYHTGGSGLRFIVPNYKFRTVRKKSRSRRLELLGRIHGSEELRERCEKLEEWKKDAMKHENSDVSMNALFESFIANGVHRPLYRGVPGQALEANTFRSKASCMKCRFMYEFLEEPVDSREMTLWPCLRCAEEAYSLKAEMGSLGPPEAKDGLRQELTVIRRNSHLPSTDRD